MLNILRNNILVALLFLLSTNTQLCAKSLPYPDNNLTEVQLAAVMSIITNFILSDDGATVDVTAPVFTSSSIITVAENQTSAVSVLTTDASSVSYAITGGDSADFSINSSTGIISFKTVPDFETRDTYSFTVIATDSAGNVSSQTVTIHISDVLEDVLKKTGQTKSYDASGNEVTDDSLKDDGFYQKGVAPSYTRDDNTNIVTDHITDLEWQDDIEMVEKKWITQANYDANNYADTSGDTATTYCANLALNGGGWRLPTRKELVGLVDYGHINTAINSIFINNKGGIYWSTTVDARFSFNAWAVYFYFGYLQSSSKSASGSVRCVRSAN